MAYVEREMGHVRRGKNGRGGTEAAEIAHVSFDHFTSRPVGEGVIDPQTHTHVIAFTSSALTQSGHVGSINLSRLKGFTKEAGAVYQAVRCQGAPRAWGQGEARQREWRRAAAGRLQAHDGRLLQPAQGVGQGGQGTGRQGWFELGQAAGGAADCPSAGRHDGDQAGQTGPRAGRGRMAAAGG